MILWNKFLYVFVSLQLQISSGFGLWSFFDWKCVHRYLILLTLKVKFHWIFLKWYNRFYEHVSIRFQKIYYKSLLYFFFQNGYQCKLKNFLRCHKRLLLSIPMDNMRGLLVFMLQLVQKKCSKHSENRFILTTYWA